MLLTRKSTCFAHTLKLMNIYCLHKEASHIKVRFFKTVSYLP